MVGGRPPAGGGVPVLMTFLAELVGSAASRDGTVVGGETGWFRWADCLPIQKGVFRSKPGQQRRYGQPLPILELAYAEHFLTCTLVRHEYLFGRGLALCQLLSRW